ncbi:immunoglobulin domain-containing protein [Actomonas aquatica]|uniref:Immunoglobulin domain-containing protein n=1 Tax=Actomonas aquatica TaxID=2866162 RepID=A0ABZ1C7D7_9BACT|nr:immunoglobulin domain-containing protein [Opitutus sp. WL0086]WRQ87376.1 immunoglobulin domain-containing protein [Opitutus sp. WL0086]
MLSSALRHLVTSATFLGLSLLSLAQTLSYPNWTVSSTGIPGARSGTSVAYGYGYWVMTLSGGSDLTNAVARSDDGLTWTPADQVFSQNARVHFFSGYFYILDQSSVYRSVDGRTWELVTNTGTMPYIRDIASSEDAIVANSSNGNYRVIQTSTDGDNWSLQPLPALDGGAAGLGETVTNGGGYFWHAHSTNSLQQSALSRSSDGTNWSNVATPWGDTMPHLSSVTYGNGRLVLSSSSQLTISTDRGESYTQITKPQSARHSVLFAGGRFFGSSTLGWSLDAATWSQPVYTDQQRAFNDVAYGDGKYVAVGGYVVTPSPGHALIAVWSAPEPAKVLTHPEDRVAAAGTSTGFSFQTEPGVSIAGYQWTHDGSPIPGATQADLIIPNASPADAGRYACLVTRNGLTIATDSARLEVVASDQRSRLVNLSVRSQTGNGDATFITGFIVGGENTQGLTRMLVRGVGPSLLDFDVADASLDSVLEIYLPAGAPSSRHDNWGGEAALVEEFTRLGAFAFSSTDSLDAAAVLEDLGPGNVSVHTLDAAGEAKTALSEIYDANPSWTPTAPRLINLSCRTTTGREADGQAVTVGFVISGGAHQGVLIRAVGPGLSQFGIQNYASNPSIYLYQHRDGQTQWKAQKVNSWGTQYTTEQNRVGAFPLSSGSADSVMLEFLEPGVYSVKVENWSGDPGVVLIELYELP